MFVGRTIDIPATNYGPKFKGKKCVDHGPRDHKTIVRSGQPDSPSTDFSYSFNFGSHTCENKEELITISGNPNS